MIESSPSSARWYGGMQMIMEQAWVTPQLVTDYRTAARQGLRGFLGLPQFSRGAEPPPLRPLTLTACPHWGQSPSGLLVQVRQTLR